MRRREFITLLAGTATAWPLTGRAQQRAMPMIGILMGGSGEAFAPFESAFRKGLNEGGLPEGGNMPFEFVRANRQFDRLPALAALGLELPPALVARADEVVE